MTLLITREGEGIAVLLGVIGCLVESDAQATGRCHWSFEQFLGEFAFDCTAVI